LTTPQKSNSIGGWDDLLEESSAYTQTTRIIRMLALTLLCLKHRFENLQKKIKQVTTYKKTAWEAQYNEI